jgi:hypothetical protein
MVSLSFDYFFFFHHFFYIWLRLGSNNMKGGRDVKKKFELQIEK